MSFEVFKKKINEIIARVNDNVGVVYAYNEKEGKFWARFTDGTVITGHPSGRKITVRYGGGHQMMAAI